VGAAERQNIVGRTDAPRPDVALSDVGAAIASLAILKVNSDAGHDYIDGFVPFAVECLRLADQREVSLEELDGRLRKEFGFNVPLPALKTVLHRAARDGFVEVKGGIYIRTAATEASGTFPARRAEALRRYRGLVDRLVAYAAERHELTWSREEAEAALYAHIQDQAVPILSAVVEGAPIVAANTSPTREAKFVVSAFILELADSEPEHFEYLEVFTKGAMLASVLFFPNLGETGRRFERLDAYFDTPILLRAIGAHGPVAERAAQQLIGLAYELGIRPLCFRSTFDETLGVLNGAAYALRRYGSHALDPSQTVEYLLEEGLEASDVEMLIGRLGKVLQSLRIQVVDRPAPNAAMTVDELRLEEVVQEQVHYRRPEALKHDLDAATAIHRLRGGEIHRGLEYARAIFVTTNSPLARGIRLFFAEHYGAQGVPLCFLDHHFGTLLWLKKPTAAPELPRDLLISSCYAALNPPDALWHRYITEIERLRQRGDVTEDDYHLLRFDLGSKSSLLALTGGNQDAFVEGTVPEILKRARANARRETEERLTAEAHRAERAEKAERDHARKADAEREDRRAQYRIVGNAFGATARWAILGAGFVIAAVLAALSYFGLTGWPVLVIALPAAVASGLGVLDLGVGKLLRTRALSIDVLISTRVASRLEHWIESGVTANPEDNRRERGSDKE
jgi:hypothetical protein